jgi:hypothetical protein
LIITPLISADTGEGAAGWASGEAEEREQERRARPEGRERRGAQRVEAVVAAAGVHDAEAQEQRERAEVRDQQVQEPGAADGGALVVGGDEEVRGERHRFPRHHEEVRVVGEDDERHRREEHVVLQADEPQAPRGLVAEVPDAVHRQPDRDGAEEQEEEPGERVEPQVERQVRQPEGQHERLGRRPRRLQPEDPEREGGGGAEGEEHAAREEGVAGGDQPGQPDRQPGEGGKHGPGEHLM